MNALNDFINEVILGAMGIYGGACRKRYLRLSKHAGADSERRLLSYLRRNRNTEFGRKYGFGRITSAEEYSRAVPFTSYPDYADMLERTAMKNEQRLITADRISFFAKTSGTTGVTKRIPVVDRSYKPYLRCASIYIKILRQEMKRRGIKRGRGLNTIETEYSYTPGGIKEGFISAYALSSVKTVTPFINCLPKEIFGYGDDINMKYVKARFALADRGLVYMMSVFMSTLTDLMHYIEENRELLISDIAGGSITAPGIPEELRQKLLKHIRPDKARAEEIRAVLDSPEAGPVIPRLWKNMCLIVAIGTGEFEPFSKKMREYCGGDIRFCYEMYAASEALFASALNAEDENYLLIPDGGFFEFIPVDEEFDEEHGRPLLMNELKVGELYEIVLTSLAGLYRYRIKDVVRVVGYEGEVPLIRFGYRKDQLINVTGVKLTSEHLSTAIRSFEERVGVRILDYSLYPDTSYTPWRITAFMEPENDIPEELRGSLSAIFDEELSKVNAEHGRMLKVGESSPSEVLIVKPDTYRRLRAENAKRKLSGNQVKTVRFIDTKEKLDYFMDAVADRLPQGREHA